MADDLYAAIVGMHKEKKFKKVCGGYTFPQAQSYCGMIVLCQ